MENNDFRLDVPDFDGNTEKPVSEQPLPVSDTTTPPPYAETSEPMADTPPLFETPPEYQPTPPDPAGAEAEIPQPDGRLENIERRLDELMARFDARIAYDQGKDALFDKMYAELASYKADIYAKLLKPLILSVSSMLDEANSFMEKAAAEEPDPARMKKYIANIAMDLEEMLEVNGVDIYAEESDVFNPSTQRVVGQTPTDDPALDNHIASRRRKGYRWNGVILRPEMVTIYKCRQN